LIEENGLEQGYQVPSCKIGAYDVPVSHPLVLRKLPKGLISVTIIKNRSVSSDDSICRGYGGKGM